MKKAFLILICILFIGGNIPCSEAKTKGGYNQHDVTVISGLSEKQIKELLPNKLKVLSKGLYNIEHSKKPINAIFLSSVIRLETGNGTSYLYRVKNNIGGVKGRYGYRMFNTKEQCLYYMQDFLYRGYIKQNRKSVWRIGQKYCVGGSWAKQVHSIALDMMKRNWK